MCHGKRIKWLNTLVTAVVIFCLMGATSNSMGVGLMQIGAGLEAALGISSVSGKLAFAAIFVTVIFILLVFPNWKRFEAGIFRLYVFLLFLLAYVFLFGNTEFITKITSNPLDLL